MKRASRALGVVGPRQSTVINVIQQCQGVGHTFREDKSSSRGNSSSSSRRLGDTPGIASKRGSDRISGALLP